MSEEDAFKNLACAIVIQAIEDWRSLCRKNKPHTSFAGLRRFFKSNWCDTLCVNTDPLLILNILERERKAAAKQKSRRAKQNVRLGLYQRGKQPPVTR